MMKKNLIIILFICFLYFIIQNVKATDYTCSYEGSKSDYNLSANIILYDDSQYSDIPFLEQKLIFSYTNGNEVENKLNIYNYSAEWAGGSFQWKNIYNYKDIKTLKKYYDGFKACPPFLAIFNDPLESSPTIRAGILTDFSDIKTDTGKSPEFILNLMNPDEEKTDDKEVAKACEFNFSLEYKEKKENLIVDYTIFFSDKKVTSSSSVIVGDTTSFFSTDLNCLEKLYVCVYRGSVNNKHPIFVSTNEENMKSELFETLTLYDLSNNTDISNGFRTYEEFCDKNCDFKKDLSELLLLDCDTVSATSEGQTTIKLGNGGCPIFQDFVDSINLESKYTLAYNRLNELKTYCSSVIKNANFSPRKSSCIYRCLNVSDEVDLSRFSEGSSACGLSGKLIIWISNIVRWGKYIVPVVVIVLGILDFIKAIASEKDDEMKKAQGRFTKRLISAALIFIVPFIIEFVLNKMGFSSNGCGIIDL